MTIRVDLNTAIIPENHSAFLARPGEDSRFASIFDRMNIVGPDLPFMELSRGTSIEQHADMSDMLKRADAFRRWRRWSTEPVSTPPTELSAYRSKERLHHRSESQFRAVLKGYFETAKKGDLALLPPSRWISDALLVEFSTKPSEFVYREVPCGKDYNATIPVREFRTVARVPKRFLPQHVLEVVGTPCAFGQFGPADTNDLISLAYDDFSRGDQFISRFHVGNQHYALDHDVYFMAFVKFVSANLRSVLEQSEQVYSIEDALLKDFGDYTPELQSNVNSPGWLRLKGKQITPLVVSVLLTLAVVYGIDILTAVSEEQVIIENSLASPDDPCAEMIQYRTDEFLKMMHPDAWGEACDWARKIHEEAGIRSQSKVSNTDGR